jgi:hypothetical protein
MKQVLEALLDSMGMQIFQKSGSHIKILGVKWVKVSKVRKKNPKILDSKVQNLVATAT